MRQFIEYTMLILIVALVTVLMLMSWNYDTWTGTEEQPLSTVIEEDGVWTVITL